jgi:NAD(P) transhydrogenase subunit alpha
MIAIGVPAEGADEPRIGLTPETVKKLVKAGAEVTIRSGAGDRSHFSDQDYAAAGQKSPIATPRRSAMPISC